jgi:hypothetical protein
MSLRILLMFTLGWSVLVWSMNDTNEENAKAGEAKLDNFQKRNEQYLPKDLYVIRNLRSNNTTICFSKSFNFAYLPELKPIEEIFKGTTSKTKFGCWTCEKAMYHDEVWCRQQD